MTCPIHGDFEIAPSLHSRGCGCTKCADEKSAIARRSDLAHILESFEKAHGDVYDYSLVADYKNSQSKVDINCKEHGIFSCSISNHIRGKGCPKCSGAKISKALVSTKEAFVEKANTLHNTRYTYDDVVYVRNSVKVIIKCPIHGDFQQQPSNHLMGQGCPDCQKNGYSQHKPGYFYILTHGNITKVGITNREIEFRVKAVSRSSGKDFLIHAYCYFSEGAHAFKLEQESLKYLASKYLQVGEIFDGYTECFLDVDLTDLLNFVTPATTQTQHKLGII